MRPLLRRAFRDGYRSFVLICLTNNYPNGFPVRRVSNCCLWDYNTMQPLCILPHAPKSRTIETSSSEKPLPSKIYPCLQ